MIIRRATAADIHKVSRLWVKLVKETQPGDTPNADMWRDRMQRMFQMQGYFMFVAEEGGKILGFSSFTITNEPAMGEVQAIGQYIYVDPDHRKGKIGALLHKENLKAAKDNGAQSWVLLCSGTEKPLWMKHGFVEKGYMMIKKLDAEV